MVSHVKALCAMNTSSSSKPPDPLNYDIANWSDRFERDLVAINPEIE